MALNPITGAVETSQQLLSLLRESTPLFHFIERIGTMRYHYAACRVIAVSMAPKGKIQPKGVNPAVARSLSHESMPRRAEKPLEINLIEAAIGFQPG
ncbi:hypothetical protein DSCA_25890 [Desulfosarcina alkanivorans]|uniref:Uncharacterized protein n=1 Tax=Desulfosarcina alkanivorans TaxID=571177 RepID=A0A5K7YL98_9BACT|nr:hypothetical protein DSCA_25890 [Desulfosarcina alkanivorans]